MSILDKQLIRRTTDKTLESMREGKLPTSAQLFGVLKDLLHQAEVGPTFKPSYQRYRKTWDYQGTNNALRDIKFDLDIAFAESVDQLSAMIRRLALVELTYTSQKTSIEQLIGALRNLLFLTKNAEDIFFGAFDTFTDLSKTDLANTARDAVDLNEGVVILPQGDPTSSRVDMSHLYTKSSWPALARVIGTGSILQNQTGPGSQFGNAFADFVNSWRQLVTTNGSTGASLEFTIPISADPDQEITITRIAVISGSANEMKMELLKSTDNVNFTKLPGVPDEVLVKPGKVVAVDFEATRVQFIRFIFTLTTPTIVDAGSYGYVFGLKNISFYRMGRVQQVEFRSLPLAPVGLEDPIDRVSMNVLEAIPGNCTIEYFVAPADEDGAPRNNIWHPINPLTREQKDGIPQVVRFGGRGDVSVRLPATSPALAYDTVRNVDYFRLTDGPLEKAPKFGTAVLWRGNNAWARNANRTSSVKEIRDAFVDFTPGDTQNLYAVATDIPDIESEMTTTQGSGKTQTALTVRNEIDYDVSTMSLTPPPQTDSQTDQRPRYAIYKVERFRDAMVIENESVVIPADDSWASLANYGVQAIGAGRPYVTNLAGSVSYTEGRDYILEVDPDTSAAAPVLTGRIKRRPNQAGTTNSNISFGQTIRVSYSLQSDLTHMVDAARGAKVFLKKDFGVIGDQYFQVTYRFVPRPPNNTIRKSSINVTQTYGDVAGGVTYAEGPDYLIDAVQGTITRVPGGKIQGNLQAFVDMQYEQAAPDLDTFTTWVRTDSKDPMKVEYNPLGIDLDVGERVSVDDIDISRMVEFPELLFGWHRIVVRSKRPEANSGAAINLVAGMFDRTNDPVFLTGGKYFAEMVATREPMLQRTYTQLTKSTAVADHGFFAVTDDLHIVVNFEPSTTEEIYTYGIRRGTAAEDLVLDLWPEEFWLSYQYVLDVDDPVRKLLVKVVLNRSSAADGGLTPKLYEYGLRVA